MRIRAAFRRFVKWFDKARSRRYSLILINRLFKATYKEKMTFIVPHLSAWFE